MHIKIHNKNNSNYAHLEKKDEVICINLFDLQKY